MNKVVEYDPDPIALDIRFDNQLINDMMDTLFVPGYRR